MSKSLFCIHTVVLSVCWRLNREDLLVCEPCSVDLFICHSLLESFVGFKRVVASARLLKGRKHFSQSVMGSLAVSKLGKTAPFFVTPKAKVNSVYYCDEVLVNRYLTLNT